MLRAILLATLLISIAVWARAQTCECRNNPDLNDLISCDTIKLNNKAKIFWNFNCDSSWLTFESPSKIKTRLFTLEEELIDLTGKLGPIYIQEYKKRFLMLRSLISGCCTPPEYYLYDKFSGELKLELGRLIYYSTNRLLPIVVSLADSSSDSSNHFNSLTIYNIDTNKKFFFPLPKNEIAKALEKTGELYPEYLFEEPVLKGKVIALTYMLGNQTGEKPSVTRTIKIDLAKYCP